MNKEKMAYGIAILCMIALSVVTAFAASGRKGVTTHMVITNPERLRA